MPRHERMAILRRHRNERVTGFEESKTGKIAARQDNHETRCQPTRKTRVVWIQPSARQMRDQLVVREEL